MVSKLHWEFERVNPISCSNGHLYELELLL